MMDNFPIQMLNLRTKESIPWSIIEPHEQQAMHNHTQTLKRLAERGGLSYCEALAVLEDRRWTHMDESEAKARVMELVQSHNRGNL